MDAKLKKRKAVMGKLLFIARNVVHPNMETVICIIDFCIAFVCYLSHMKQ